MNTRTVVIVAVSMLLMVSFTQAAVISIDVVANGSDAVSGDVAGGLTGQTGLWNALPLDGSQITLAGLKDGDQQITGVDFVFDAYGVGYHLQGAGSPYSPGVVLADDNPERSWNTGGESPYTFKFTGLVVGTQYDLAIYGTGYGDAPESALKSYIINGTTYEDPANIHITTQTADSNGEIIVGVACGGEGYQWYAEVSGVQLAEVPEPATMALLAFGGLAALRRRNRR